MRKNCERIYWMTNKEWYTLSADRKSFVLTESAPLRAQKSFSMWQRPPRKNLRQIARIIRTYLY